MPSGAIALYVTLAPRGDREYGWRGIRCRLGLIVRSSPQRDRFDFKEMHTGKKNSCHIVSVHFLYFLLSAGKWVTYLGNCHDLEAGNRGSSLPSFLYVEALWKFCFKGNVTLHS